MGDRTRQLLSYVVTSLAVAACAGTTDATTPGTRTSSGSSGEACSEGGPFEREKPPNPPPCCTGLHDTVWARPRPGPRCGTGMGVYYSCLKGTCGDGICEPGEDIPCGCAKDCPRAADAGP